MRNILLTILSILLILLISLITQGNPWLPLMALLGASAGIEMALTYPFDLVGKLLIVASLFISLIAMTFGWKKAIL